MSQATTEVAPSGPQEVSRGQGTWVEMTVEDSDDEDEEWDPHIRVFNPVESDDDSVLDALRRHLEGDVGPQSQFENDVSPTQCPERFQHVGNTAVPAKLVPSAVPPIPDALFEAGRGSHLLCPQRRMKTAMTVTSAGRRWCLIQGHF